MLFVLSLLSPSANAQLDKQYQEQERLNNIKKAKHERFFDLAQYSKYGKYGDERDKRYAYIHIITLIKTNKYLQ